MRRLIMTVVLLITCTAHAYAADDSQLRTCVGALNAFTRELSKPTNSSVGRDWVSQSYGNVFLDSGLSRDVFKKKYETHVGRTAELTSCVSRNIPMREILLFLNAYHGLLPADPLEGLAKCIAVSSATNDRLERVLGTKSAEKIGGQIGSLQASTIVQVIVIYKIGGGENATDLQKNAIYVELKSRSANHLKQLNSIVDARARAAMANHFADQCTLYGIPLYPVAIAAETAGTASR